MPQAAEIVKAIASCFGYRIQTKYVSGDVVVKVIAYNRRLVQGDKGVPGFRGLSQAEDVMQRQGGYNLNLQLAR